MLLIELIFFFFFLLLFHYFYNIHTMSTLILSITTILLMIIAPAFCGTLYALSNGEEGDVYYSINPDNADDVTKLNNNVNGFFFSLDIQYDCLSTKMYGVSKSWDSNINGWVPKIQEMDPYNGNVVDGT
eukprot:218446_1